MKKISIARDFSVYPGGRTPEDGEYSGQEFRNSFLIPALLAKQETIIDFDGTRGYGSSFLEEAFGGLVRAEYSKSDIRKFLKFTSERQSIVDEVNSYIDKA